MGLIRERRRQDRLVAETKARQTFGLLADEYLERQQTSGAAAATSAKTTWLLKDLAASLSDRPVHEITSAEILALLRSVEKSGCRETARRLRGVISSVFKLAIVTLRAEGDPTIALHGALLPPKVQGRAAITKEQEFGKLL